ncbi:Flavin-containing monooxygenase [Rhynchospora pubera]|uniref:indole-3-pyruvate monooxygenase n=1 Tax=Rhynchospora pubera TaxID=906938 RepID=A0AAV8CNZ2_9POAL|nr:Flavin-containing monooxygenase [Rhynchospora pubera]KAJ4762513.1 Flavin-containing monooxygenase [Rhynchospora pubera]
MISKAKQVWVPGPLIVGAGPSGLAVAACLESKGVPSIILEKDLCIASSWKLRMYERLKLHLPKQFCELPHLPFPKEFPTYPTREQFISYIDSYAKAFCIEPLFGMSVESAAYDAGIGFWKVQANGLEFISRWLIVATGENAEAFRPEITGMPDYTEVILHTCEYKKGDDFRGKKVLVVGCGNSGMEVCLDLCNNGAQPSMVVRDKLHILPREILGISTFGLSMFLMRWLPMKHVDSFLLLCARLLLGDTEKFGLKRPKIGPLQFKMMSGKTPVLDVGTLAKIKNGEIKVVPGINHFTSKGVEFTDGRQEDFDAVILATGYRSNVPSWLKEEDFFDQRDGYPKTQFPNSWKGKNGLYAVGFTRRGLLGTSLEARWIAEDIATQWSSETRHLPYEL